ncbi:MAG TPA: F0F1 ATP synthase subunit delta [Nevskia sp.]|nr:F0F1 ATP synthase subunit delta [Nevskia sp.]
MAELHTLARPYAKAAFELAHEGRSLGQWSQTLKTLAGAVADAQVASLLANPRLSRGDVAAVLTAALGDKLDAQARNFLRLLAENNRLAALPAIAEEYEALRAEAEKRVEVEITTAAAVGEAQQQALLAALRKRLARELEVSWKTDPALVAGAVIRAGDLVIDGSVSGELAQLRQAVIAS